MVQGRGKPFRRRRRTLKCLQLGTREGGFGNHDVC